MEIDPCPWHLDTKPSVAVKLTGHRDDPLVLVEMFCPKCKVTRRYAPSDAEIQAHYESRYSQNQKLMHAVMDKLINVWNWRLPQSK